MYFDRRVAPDLHRALLPTGFASSLVEFSRSGQYALDLQFRRNPKDRRSWVTLYVGTTKVLDLAFTEKSGRFKVSADKAWANPKFGWDPAWSTSRAEHLLAADWPAVDAYLEMVIPLVPERYLKEGRVQAGISHFAADDLVIIDRETVIGFTDATERSDVTSRLRRPLMAAVTCPGPAWWKPKVPGNECDALAISRTGEVLAIEVKPAGVDIAWAPLQAHHYADLLQKWVNETPDAREVLTGMFEQRADLGLTTCTWDVTLPASIVVRPVVAVRRGASPTYVARMRRVVEQIRAAELDTPAMQFRRVNLVGRLDPWDLDSEVN